MIRDNEEPTLQRNNATTQSKIHDSQKLSGLDYENINTDECSLKKMLGQV